MISLETSGKAAVLLLVAIIAISACNYPGIRDPDPFPTYAAETVEARLTSAVDNPPDEIIPTAEATTPAPATPTDTPDAPTPTNTPIPTETEIPCNQATFISDVTIPDGTDLEPGEDFTKTWRLRNSGSCTWNTNYELLFKDGDAMGGPASQDLTGSVAPGETVDISVDLTAPSSEGSYKGFWWLRSDVGIVFGVGTSGEVAFFVDIDVVKAETVLSSGEFDLDQTWTADLDTGTLGSAAGNYDIQFDAVSATEKYLRPHNSAKIKMMSERAPSLEDCQSASLSTDPVDLNDIDPGDVFCYVTNLGNYGRLEVESISGGSTQTMHIDYLTWDS